jgi:AraC-like DNA-binding protein
MEHGDAANASISVYREFAPPSELRDYVRALAWYGPADEAPGSHAPMREFYVSGDGALAPSFADAHSSLLFPLGFSWRENAWQPCSATGATVMGALTRAVQPPGAERSAMIGVYLRPRGSAALLGVPASEVTDRVVPLRDVWRGFREEPDQITLRDVEALLVRRLSVASAPPRVMQIAELASWVHRCGGQVSVTGMADLAGLSRQHLGRLFLEHVGVGPKLYARLARFRAGLRCREDWERAGGWSRLAARLGYADQSHLIAEFREFTSFTPDGLLRGGHFHPFIGDTSSDDRPVR